MSEPKGCPFCGVEKEGRHVTVNGVDYYQCQWCGSMTSNFDRWQSRPIEDELRADLARLTAENERLSQMLHDELSQLEIATDLGNKRWLALNDIYEDGEKHNANWCKRKAQEGLGIK